MTPYTLLRGAPAPMRPPPASKLSGRSEIGSLRFFLTERYVLYSARKDALYRARIFHQPWPLHEANLLSCRSTMLESQGLPSTRDMPLLHQQGEPLKVRVWPRVRVR